MDAFQAVAGTGCAAAAIHRSAPRAGNRSIIEIRVAAFRLAAAMFGFTKEQVMTESNEQARGKIVDEFSAVLTEAEEMLKRASNETADRAKDLRSQVEAKLMNAKLRLQEFQGHAVDRAKETARATDDYVHDHPWQAIGVAAVLGFVVGLLMNRR
jgi:ElaB/YqjD/DUF883 family membrane-anchored ribosome-binding protein